MEAFRLGIVGCGKIAEASHIPAALSLPNVELCAVIDSNRERLNFITRSFRLSCFVTTSCEDLKGKVDGVLLLLPNYLHQPIGCTLLQNGIHVLCEKPLTNTTKEGELLCEAAEASGCVLAVGYATRFLPNVELMKRLLDQGFLGRLERFEYEYGGVGGWSSVSNYNLYRSQSGGGVLVANGSHFLDRMLSWFGTPHSFEYSDDSHGGIEANCLATFVFDNGLTGKMRLSKTQTIPNRFRVYGERGSLEMDERKQSSLTFIPRSQPDLKHEISATDAPQSLPESYLFQRQIEDFVHAIRTGSQPRVSGRQGLVTTSLIEQCYQSRTAVAEPWTFDVLPQLPVLREGSVETPLASPSTSGKVFPSTKPVNPDALTEDLITPDIPRGMKRSVPSCKRECVLVTGSTGFIGSRLCEVIYLNTDWDVRPLVHTPGKASYIARYPLDLAIGDITDLSTVRRAMEGCTSVVHLAIGSDPVMRQGLRNILRASVEANVKRFVHISSVAVFGDNPPSAARYETAVTKKTANRYGNIKLDQERIVLQYGRETNLPFVILRPPLVYGPYSPFTSAVLHKLRSGNLAIVDGGMNTCNLVYIDNLVEAILLALTRDEAIAETFFVVDKDRVSWRKCLEDYAAFLGLPIPEICSSQLEVPSAPTLIDSLRQIHLVLSAGEFRHVASKHPALATVGTMLNKLYKRIIARTKTPGVLSRPDLGPRRYDATDYLMAGQHRKVEHSYDKAEKLLGYTAAIDYRCAFEMTKQWLLSTKLI